MSLLGRMRVRRPRTPGPAETGLAVVPVCVVGQVVVHLGPRNRRLGSGHSLQGLANESFVVGWLRAGAEGSGWEIDWRWDPPPGAHRWEGNAGSPTAAPDGRRVARPSRGPHPRLCQSCQKFKKRAVSRTCAIVASSWNAVRRQRSCFGVLGYARMGDGAPGRTGRIDCDYM